MTKVPAACLLFVVAGGAPGSEAPNACDWSVYYNEWVDSFIGGEFEPNDDRGGAHCLEACCQDDECAGVQLHSSLDSQCYRYDEVPDLPKDAVAQPIDAFLRVPRATAWSVFVKRSLPPGQAAKALPVPVTEPPAAMAHKEEALDQQLRHLESSPQACSWTVNYDAWIPTFDSGEYEHNDALGGRHCLEACCEDPLCLGLALESSEMYQCYKYSNSPRLDTPGRPLGDGRWLLSKPKAWSVFIKGPPPRHLAPAAPGTAAAAVAPPRGAAPGTPASAGGDRRRSSPASAEVKIGLLLVVVAVFLYRMLGAARTAFTKAGLWGHLEPESLRLMSPAVELPLP